VKLSEYARRNNITYKTAHRMWKSGLLEGYQLPTGTLVIREREQPYTVSSGVALYARVSGSDQKDDAQRQMQRLRDFAAARGLKVAREVIEIASGLNDTRPKLMALLSDTAIATILVEHRDRLTRFGFNYIKQLLETQGRSIEVINDTDTKDELVDDFVAVITAMAARIYGRRSSKKRVLAVREVVERAYSVEDADG
jgi:predicted site-specific integrase-resolvase